MPPPMSTIEATMALIDQPLERITPLNPAAAIFNTMSPVERAQVVEGLLNMIPKLRSTTMLAPWIETYRAHVQIWPELCTLIHKLFRGIFVHGSQGLVTRLAAMTSSRRVHTIDQILRVRNLDPVYTNISVLYDLFDMVQHVNPDNVLLCFHFAHDMGLITRANAEWMQYVPEILQLEGAFYADYIPSIEELDAAVREAVELYPGWQYSVQTYDRPQKFWWLQRLRRSCWSDALLGKKRAWFFNAYFSIEPDLRSLIIEAWHIALPNLTSVESNEAVDLLAAIQNEEDPDTMMDCARKTDELITTYGRYHGVTFGALAAISWPDDRTRVFLRAQSLPAGTNGEAVGELLTALDVLEPGDDFTNIPELAKRLPIQSSASNGLGRTIEAIREIAPERREELIQAASVAMPLGLPETDEGPGRDSWGPLLRALSRAHVSELQQVAIQVAEFASDTNGGQARAAIVATLLSLPFEERASFIPIAKFVEYSGPMPRPGSDDHITGPNAPMRILARLRPRTRHKIVEMLEDLAVPRDRTRYYWLVLTQVQGNPISFFQFATDVMNTFGTHTSMFRELSLVPVQDRSEITATLDLFDIDIPAINLLNFGFQILDIPAGNRLAAAQAIAGAIPDQRLQPGVLRPDDNVMNTNWIEAVSRSIHWLVTTYPLHTIPHRTIALHEIETYLRTYASWATPAEISTLQSRRDVPNADTEYDNAIHVLTAPKQGLDLTGPLSDNDDYIHTNGTIGLGDLTALVWHAINIYPDAAEQALMRWAVLRALSFCIDHDDHAANHHRVCGVGFAGRMVRVLQGRYPLIHADPELPRANPQQIVTWAAKKFSDVLEAEGREEPVFVEIAQFYCATLEESEAVYPAGSAESAELERHLMEYLKFTYENVGGRRD